MTKHKHHREPRPEGTPAPEGTMSDTDAQDQGKEATPDITEQGPGEEARSDAAAQSGTDGEPQAGEEDQDEGTAPESGASNCGCLGDDSGASSFCVAAGKCTGNLYRAVADKSSRLVHFIEGASKSVADEAAMVARRVGNLFKTVKKDTQLTHWEMKRRDDFARLGEELFHRKEAELEKLLPDEDFKELLAQVRADEERIRNIENEKVVQHKYMREATVYGHATTQLKNPDPRIRRAALRILARLGRSEAIIKITPLLRDPDAEVRTRARETIQKLSELEGAGGAGQESTEEQDHDRSGDEHTIQPGDQQPGGAAEQPGRQPAEQPGQPEQHGEQPKEQHEQPEQRGEQPKEEHHD